MREHTLDYLVSLLDDAQEFSWGAAKASQTALLCRMSALKSQTLTKRVAKRLQEQ